MTIPDSLPKLSRGRHKPAEQRLCAMEAAAWLAGESWSDRPRTIHPVIAQVARATNDALSDDERQSLWPLILASLGTGRRLRPIVYWRLVKFRMQHMSASGEDLRTLWEMLLTQLDWLTGHEPMPAPDRLVEITRTFCQDEIPLQQDATPPQSDLVTTSSGGTSEPS